MAERQQEKTKERKLLSEQRTWYEIAFSTVIGAISGIIAGGAAVRKEFNDEFEHWPGMVEKLTDSTAATKEAEGLIAQYRTKLYDLDKLYRNQPEKRWEHIRAKRVLKDALTEDSIKLLESYGIKTRGLWEGGIKGTILRYKHLGTSTKKLDVWFKGISIGTIIGVGVYNLVTSIATRKKAREIEGMIIDKFSDPDVRVVKIEPEPKRHPGEPDPAHPRDHQRPGHEVSGVRGHERVQASHVPEITARA
jgi:hypothetical protein